MAKQLQREREIVEQLDCGKGSDTVSKSSASAAQSDLKKRRPPSAVEGENHPTAVQLADGSMESLKHELQSLQQSRQRFEGFFTTGKLAQMFVQDQVSAYCCAETELLKELKTEMEQSPVPLSSCSGSRRSSQRTTLSSFQRVLTFSTGYANSSQPVQSLLAQLQPLREPIIPNEPPVPAPKFLEVVHYPSSSPALEPPAKFFLFAPLPSTPWEKADDEEAKTRAKRPNNATSAITTRSKIKQERGYGQHQIACSRAVVLSCPTKEQVAQVQKLSPFQMPQKGLQKCVNCLTQWRRREHSCTTDSGTRIHEGNTVDIAAPNGAALAS